MKPKQNHKADPNTPQSIDKCLTPGYALDPLLPYLGKSWRVWEPAAGRGHIVRALERAGFSSPIASELEDVQPDDMLCRALILGGRNFFRWQPVLRDFDAIVTNPPYSLKPQFIERCYHLGKPFALLVPVETIGSGDVQRMMEQHGAELLLLNKRVNFIMPNIGLEKDGKKSSAQFPVLWFCWRMLPRPIVYGRITRRLDEQLSLLEATP